MGGGGHVVDDDGKFFGESRNGSQSRTCPHEANDVNSIVDKWISAYFTSVHLQLPTTTHHDPSYVLFHSSLVLL